MPIHTNDLSAASDIALECLIRRVVDLHLDPSIYSQEFLSHFSQEFLSQNYPEWAAELPGVSHEEAIALLATATRTLQLKMEVQTHAHQQVRRIYDSLQDAELAVSQAMTALGQIPLQKAGHAKHELGFSQEFLQNAIRDLKGLLEVQDNANSR